MASATLQASSTRSLQVCSRKTSGHDFGFFCNLCDVFRASPLAFRGGCARGTARHVPATFPAVIVQLLNWCLGLPPLVTCWDIHYAASGPQRRQLALMNLAPQSCRAAVSAGAPGVSAGTCSAPHKPALGSAPQQAHHKSGPKCIQYLQRSPTQPSRMTKEHLKIKKK